MLTQEKRRDREQMVATAAHLAISTTNAKRRESGLGDLRVKLNQAGPMRVIDNYVARLQAFKKRHGYGDGERVNRVKIAGLIAESLLEIAEDKRAPKAFFEVEAVHENEMAYLMLPQRTIFFLLSSICRIRLEDIPRSIVNDIYMCFARFDADEEWVLLALTGIALAYQRDPEPTRPAPKTGYHSSVAD
jgi:hypothetical protein